ncbi:MAG: bifunctional acetaldehyde-CoA/alcohol dehydrogenase [Alphaproteobacteria bacterium]|jgi:acetaldehyde dehydrogenase/alcohol dehydrogenase|nr:bifunctional acetaldehyde-CoA/alcohol dehydrogenase [Alphaproteobacteria bacterium]
MEKQQIIDISKIITNITTTTPPTGNVSNSVSNAGELDALLRNIKKAQSEFANFTQEQVDKIFKAVAVAANKARIPLAKMAVEETNMGVLEDKVIKNHFASEYIYNKFKDMKTVGVIEDNESAGLQKILEPMGVVAAIVPTTNPTSTAIFKILIALKTRNGIILSPHPRAAKSTVAAAKIAYEAAVAAGVPKNIVGWIEKPSAELSSNLMKHPDVDMILATGGPSMVHAAYSSGNPAIGVGAGNAPVIIDTSADIKMAVSSILISKNFDHGVICATEQAAVVLEDVYEIVKTEFKLRGAYFCSVEEKSKLAKLMITQEAPNQKGYLNSEIVGQSAYKIAEMAGFVVDRNTKTLIAEVSDVSVNEAFSYEKLSPVLGLYRVRTFSEAVKKAKELLDFEGIGHTSSLYIRESEKEKIALFSDEMKTGRILINSPSAFGAIGDVYNQMLEPSLTLGCGTWGKNSFSGNVTPMNLLNVKWVAKRRENMLWFKVPPKIYHKFGCLPFALTDLKGKKRAFIITDNAIAGLYLDRLTKVLENLKIDYRVFSDVQPDPTLAEVHRGADLMKSFSPDVIIALGGGSPMDAAKIMRVMYEYPDTSFEDISMRFMDIRKRIIAFPEVWKTMFVAIPTTSGTGSEVTPFSVITDEITGEKYPLADYAITPDMAIVDAELVMSQPKSLTAISGFDAISHATEALASMMATPYTDPLAMEALYLLFENLPIAYRDGSNIKARENVHNAATIAGLSFANAFLGISHSLAHKLGAAFHMPHGLCNAMVLENVVRFNMVDNPKKQGVFPQYEYPNVKSKYARLANYLGLPGRTDDEKVESFLGKLKEIRRILGIDYAIKDYGSGISESEFRAKLDKIAEDAFDDQCTGANPRYPTIDELKEILIASYFGRAINI